MCGSRCGFPKVQGNGLTARAEYHGKPATGNVPRLGIGDRQGESDGHGRVGRISPLFQDLHAHRRSQGLRGHDGLPGRCDGGEKNKGEVYNETANNTLPVR